MVATQYDARTIVTMCRHWQRQFDVAWRAYRRNQADGPRDYRWQACREWVRHCIRCLRAWERMPLGV